MSSNRVILRAENLSKSFFDQKHEVEVFRNVSLEVRQGCKIAIVGASGSGKSTLMHTLSGLDLPTSGDVYLHDHHFNVASETKRGELRNQYLGFIYQFHHLLPEFSALDNVALPIVIGGGDIKQAREAAKQLLIRVGLGHRVEHKPSELSGGERQRVAIARALVARPSAVLADEPTGNLDEDNARSIFDLMCEINDEIGTALVVVTHDRSLAKEMDEQWEIRDFTLQRVEIG